VDFGTLLLQFLVALSDNLMLLLALILEQVLKIFPQIDHLAWSEVRGLAWHHIRILLLLVPLE